MPPTAHWLEWKKTCALGLCSPVAQAALRAFVHARFLRYTSFYAESIDAGNSSATSPDAREAWQWFESYFELQRTRAGKSYKEWLFSRASDVLGPTTGDIESGVSLLLRNVVRSRLREDYSSPRMLSLDANIVPPSQGAAVSLGELLPDDFDTADEVERRELERMADALAAAAATSLSHRERIALLGRELGLSLANPQVVQAAECGKTALAEAYQTALRAVASYVADAYPRETRAYLAALAVSVFAAVRRRIVSWARAEKSLSGLLTIGRGGPLTISVTAAMSNGEPTKNEARSE